MFLFKTTITCLVNFDFTMESGDDSVICKETVEQSYTPDVTEELVDNTHDCIITPPARENSEVEIDYIDELDEIFGLSLDDEEKDKIDIGRFHIDDLPLDGKSPEFSSESTINDDASDDNNLKADYVQELEKMESQSDISTQDGDTESGNDGIEATDETGDAGLVESRPETRGMETVTPTTGLGLTTRTATELQLSTWRSTLVSDCETASRSSMSRGIPTSAKRSNCDDRMSSGKKSTVQFYGEEDDDVDVELSR